MVVTETVRNDAATTDQAVGRLQAGDAAGRGRPADRTAGIAAQRRRREARRDRGGRTRGRAGRRTGAIPRVARRREQDVPRRTAMGELPGRVLAQEHAACCGELLLRVRIPRRDIVRQQLRHGRRPDARGVEDVF